jgi:hypothetical protein
MNALEYEIEETLKELDEEKLPYNKKDMIQLILFIEKRKYSFWEGNITAKQLLHKVNTKLEQFKTQNPEFDFLHDAALRAYYPKASDLRRSS